MEKDDANYLAFVERFKRDFNRSPNADQIQGYDMGMYLLQVLDRFDYQQGISLDKYIRAYGLHNGYHINYGFEGKFDNQQVHIIAFGGKGFEKLK